MRLHHSIASFALGLSLLAGAASAQVGGGGLIVNGLSLQPMGGAVLIPGGNERTAQFVCFDDSLSQGVTIPCDSMGGAQCVVGMGPIVSTPGARLRVWQLMQGQSGNAAMHVTCTSVAGGGVECVGDFSSLGVTGVVITLRDRFGNEIARSTCPSSVCSLMVTDNGGGTVGGGGWEFSCAAKSAGYDLKKAVKCRVMSGQATVSGGGFGGAPHVRVASIEWEPYICFTEPCPPSPWTTVSAMQVSAGTGGSPVALPIDVSNPALCSWSWGVSNPTHVGGGGMGAGKVAVWASGGGTLQEECENLGIPCDALSRVVRVSGLDGPGSRSATIDFDPDELDAAQTHGSNPGKFSDARSVSFQVVPVSLSAGQTSGVITCDVRGRDALSGLPTSLVQLDLTGNTFSCSQIVVRSVKAGLVMPVSRVRCVSATGQVLARSMVQPTDAVSFQTQVPMPVITVDPSNECVVDCTGGGGAGATCQLPSGQVVSGVAKLIYSPTTPLVGVGCDQVRVSGTHFPTVKLVCRRSVNPLMAGGLPVLPVNHAAGITDWQVGDWAIFNGTTWDHTSNTLSWEPPVLDALGNPTGGMQILYGGKNGVGCDIDLQSCLNTAGAKLKLKHKGWDGTIHGQYRVSGGGGGHGDVVCDFTEAGAVSVHYEVRNSIGEILAQGDIPGALAACAIDTTCCGGPPPPGGATDWSVSSSRVGNWDLKQNKRTAAFTVTGLGPTPITGAAGISFTRIVCIVAPCPGDGTTAMAAMDIEGGGMPVVKIAKPRVVTGKAVPIISVASKAVPITKVYPLSNKGTEAVFPVCSYVGPCDATTESLCLTNIGVDGSDGLVMEPSEPASSASCSAKFDCMAVPPVEGEPSTTLAFMGDNIGAYSGTSQPVLASVTIVPRPPTGSVELACDMSGRGSSECRVECLSSTGVVLASSLIPNHAVVVCPGAMSGQRCSYIGTCDADNRVTIAPFASTGSCVLPNGTVVQNVATLRWTPLVPKPQSRITSVVASATCVENSDTVCDFTFAVHSGGLELTPVGQAVLTPRADGAGVDVTSLSCSGNDGVRIGLETGNGGGFALPVGDLFAGARPCGGPRIRIKHKGWDGSEFARTTLHRVDTGGAMTETYQSALTGVVVALDVNMLAANGDSRGQVTVPGTAVTWTNVAEGNSATLDKAYWNAAPSQPGTGTNAAMRSANEGFFDIATRAPRTVTVTGLTPSPITGVHSISVRPISAVGAVVTETLGSFEVVGHSMETISVIDPSRVRLAHGGAYPPPDRFVELLGTGAALVHEKCASIYPCPWDTQEVVVSNIGSSGQDGVRLRPVSNIGSSGQDGVDFAVVSCGSWGETGFPTIPILGAMDVSFGNISPTGGHVTVLKLHVTVPNGAAAMVEDVTCEAGSGAPAVLARVYSHAGVLLDSGMVSPNQPVRVTYCSMANMPTFGNTGDECYLSLPDIGIACYTLQIANHAPVSGGKVVFQDLSFAGAPVSEVRFTGSFLENIELEGITMDFPPACTADLGQQGGVPGGDHQLDNNDFVVFIQFFFTSDPRADLGVQGGGAGHDGFFDNNDFVAFIDAFFAGCP